MVGKIMQLVCDTSGNPLGGAIVAPGLGIYWFDAKDCVGDVYQGCSVAFDITTTKKSFYVEADSYAVNVQRMQ